MTLRRKHKRTIGRASHRRFKSHRLVTVTGNYGNAISEFDLNPLSHHVLFLILCRHLLGLGTAQIGAG